MTNAIQTKRSALRRSATWLLFGGLLASPAFLASCSGGSGGDPNNPGAFKVRLISNGFGQIFPYRIRELDSFRQPSQRVVDIDKLQVLKDNLTATNSVLPVQTYPTTAVLPGSAGPGNHFMMVQFTHEIDITSVLSTAQGDQLNSGLTGSIQVLRYNPTSEAQSFVRGRAFVGGYTYYDDPTTTEFDLTLVKAVEDDGNGDIRVLDARAAGFPSGFTGADLLASPKSFVFIPDNDGVLTTFETFPANEVYRILTNSSVRDHRSKPLVEEACVATTSGQDNIQPEVLGFTATPSITPGNGLTGVDPTTSIEVTFSKPVQPREVGDFFDPTNPVPATRGITINVTIAQNTFPVNYYADPVSAGDFCKYIIRPAYSLPGSAPVQLGVGITVVSLPGRALGNPLVSTFTTGKGPGLVNAPVAPEAIYVGRSGVNAGVSVIDLNGAGQGTGDIGDTYPSNWPRNPNVGAPGVLPSLAPGTTNLDAGGEGFMTLTRDTNLSTLLIDSTIVSTVDSIHIGQPLDKVFNNENINKNTSRTNQTNPTSGTQNNAWGNSIMIPPHPNPPRLVFPPPNPSNSIFGEEPTMTTSSVVPGAITTTVPPCAPSPINALVQGDPFSKDPTKFGLLKRPVVGAFPGPQPPPPTPQPPTPFCPYTSRQQIGHFLYVLDREKKQVLVVNSNRMTVLETIRVTDPYEIALSPNLQRLAVSNFGSATVTFIDTDPSSRTFHQIVGITKVGNGASEMAWQPEGEELLVLNATDSSMSIVSGADLTLRKTVAGFIQNPVDIICSTRQTATGFQTGLYFAYILNANGTVAIYESGPDGVNGIGYDSIVGIPESAVFPGARRMQADIKSANSAVWICHVDGSNLGTVSHLELIDSPLGQQPISPNSGGFILPPTFRQREWGINGRIGGSSPTTKVRDRLSGNAPVDLAFDDVWNFGALGDAQSPVISNIAYADHSGKGMLKGAALASVPTYIFVALADTGKIDCIELDTGRRVRTIDCPGVRTLSHYWRQ